MGCSYKCYITCYCEGVKYRYLLENDIDNFEWTETTKTNKQGSLFIERTPNLSSDFIKAIKEKIGYIPTPEAIFYYIYAIFHSPTYRQRYAEFLKIDFPRFPLTSNQQLFQDLGAKGEELVELHLIGLKVQGLLEAVEPVIESQKITSSNRGKGETGLLTGSNAFVTVVERNRID